MATSHRTFCRICPPQCGMVVETDNNRILAITSDKDHPVTHEQVAKIADVSAEDLRAAAHIFGRAKRPSATSGTGANFTRHSYLVEHLIQCLNLITGAFRTAGTRIPNAGMVFKDPLDKELVIPPNRSWEQEPKLPASGAGSMFGEYPTSRLPEEIASHPSGVMLDEQDIVVAAAEADQTARLDACPPDVAQEIAAAAADFLSPSKPGADATQDYSYVLTNRRILETINGQYVGSSRTRKRYKLNPVFINPQDLEEAGISEGDRLRVTSANGSITGLAKSDRTMRSGTIAISHMWGTKSDSDVDDPHSGRLVSIDRDLQEINFMPLYSGIPVDIAPL